LDLLLKCFTSVLDMFLNLCIAGYIGCISGYIGCIAG
jgi:hypothetical protein